VGCGREDAAYKGAPLAHLLLADLPVPSRFALHIFFFLLDM
jgi:hypothetical protein